MEASEGVALATSVDVGGAAGAVEGVRALAKCVAAADERELHVDAVATTPLSLVVPSACTVGAVVVAVMVVMGVDEKRLGVVVAVAELASGPIEMQNKRYSR